MAAQFVPDPSFEREIVRHPEMGRFLRERVDAAASRAEQLAPDDPSTGAPDLHTSVFGDVAMMGPGFRGRVGAEDYKAPWFEEGASGVSPSPFLRPAVEQEIGPIGADLGGDV